MLQTALGRLRVISFIEGVSFIFLLICSVLKRTLNMPDIIKIPGYIHGLLFVLFIWALIDAHVEQKWPIKKSIIAFIVSFIPFGNFWAEYKLFRD